MRHLQIAAIAAGLFAVGSVHAATVIKQNFDGLVSPNYGQPVFVANNAINNGYYGSGVEGAWYGFNAPATSNAHAYSGTQSIAFTPRVDENNTYLGNRAILGYNNLEGLASGEFEFSLRLYQDTPVMKTNDGYFFFEATNATARGSQQLGVKIRDGALSINTYGAPSEGAVTLPDNQWVGIKLLGDLSTQKFSTYVDTGSGWTAVDVDRSFSASTVLGSGTLNGFYLTSNGGLDGPNTSVYIDSLYLGSPQAMPEPAAMGLMLLGAFGLAQRRSRRC